MRALAIVVFLVFGWSVSLPISALDIYHFSVAQLQDSANRGNAEAQYLYGGHLIRGQGIAQNTKAGTDYFRRAAAQKYAPAITALAELFDEGVGCKENQVEAIRLYKEAAAMHEPKAEWKLAYLYTAEKQDGGLGDFDKGIKLMKTAAADGSATAAMFLGRLYWLGNCKKIPRDDKEAVKMFTRAEELGSESSGHFLIRAYYEGRGVSKNLRMAITYFAKGDPSAEGKRFYKLLTSKQEVSEKELSSARAWMLAASRKNKQTEVDDFDLLNRK